MKKSFRTWSALVAVLMLAAVTGCASVPMAPPDRDAAAKQFAPVADKASVYIYRNEGIGAAIKMGIYVDDAPVAQTAASTYVNVQLAPGPHKIVGHAENHSEVALDAKAGDVTFIWQEVKMGVMSARNKMQVVDADTGKKGVNECKLVEAGSK